MRLSHVLLMLPLFCAPAYAASTTSSDTEHHGRRSAAEHFADANTTHDGHLTMQQAASGYKSIAKSFSQIDVSHHGYVTIEDIKAWRAAKKAARQAAKHTADESDAPGGVIRPGLAMLRWLDSKPIRTSTHTFLLPPTQPSRNGIDLPTAPLDRNLRS